MSAWKLYLPRHKIMAAGSLALDNWGIVAYLPRLTAGAVHEAVHGKRYRTPWFENRTYGSSIEALSEIMGLAPDDPQVTAAILLDLDLSEYAK